MAPELVLILNELDQLPGPGFAKYVKWEVKTTGGLGKRFGKLKSGYFDSRGIHHKNILVDHSFRHAFSTHLTNLYGELKSAPLTGHEIAGKALTELGRTYYHGADWETKTKMIGSLPTLS